MSKISLKSPLKQQKLHLNIKGNLRNSLYPILTRLKAKTLGLQTRSVKEVSNTHVHVIVEGESAKLWKMVDWSKKGYVFLLLQEIQFSFVDLR